MPTPSSGTSASPRQPSASERLFSSLRDRILRGELRPGDTLPPERKLAQQEGVHRTIVREALKRLQQAGLIESRRGGWSRVRDYRETGGLDLLPFLLRGVENGNVDIDLAMDVMDLRAALASDAAALAAQRRKDADLQALDKAVERMAGARDSEDLAALQPLVMDFWRLVIEASGNLPYKLAYNSMREVYARVQGPMRGIIRDELLAVDDYREIAGALRRRQPGQARRIATEVTTKGSRAIRKALERG
ncbi:MAG TPA: GntR family transcriptional regulator [Gammaproteobacteria bacterium]|nr:GntR family transcriptional regulator [Gammaproteobacteria bacterium]